MQEGRVWDWLYDEFNVGDRSNTDYFLFTTMGATPPLPLPHLPLPGISDSTAASASASVSTLAAHIDIAASLARLNGSLDTSRNARGGDRRSYTHWSAGASALSAPVFDSEAITC